MMEGGGNGGKTSVGFGVGSGGEKQQQQQQQQQSLTVAVAAPVVPSKTNNTSGKRRSTQNIRNNDSSTINSKKKSNAENGGATPKVNSSSNLLDTMNTTTTTTMDPGNDAYLPNMVPQGNNSTMDANNNSNINNSNSKQFSSELAMLRQPAIAHPQQQVTLTCYIPPNKVGAVIGRGGRSIIGIQREASRRSFNHPSPVRMSVVGTSPPPMNINIHYEKEDENANNTTDDNNNNNNNNNPQDVTPVSSAAHTHTQSHTNPVLDCLQTDPFWTPVIIRGDPCGAFAAANLLLPLIDYEMDDVVLDVPIHRSRHSAIIGRHGNTIARLSADCNVRIMVPRPSNMTINAPPNTSNTNSNNVDLDGGNFMDGKEESQPSSSSTQPPPQGSASDTNNNYVEPPEAAAVRRRRENPANIQLEGTLQNVEMCLTKLLGVVSPNTMNGTGTTATISTTNDNNNTSSNPKAHAQHVPTTTMEKGDNSNNNTLTKNSKNSNSASNLSMDTSETNNDNDANNHSIQNNNNNTNNSATNNNNNNTNSNTKRKNTEKIITAPPSSAHVLPSLTKLRQIGKKTGTTIRRKRINTAGVEMKEETQTEGDLESTKNNDNSDKGDTAPTQYETQFIITGRVESVERCVELFQSMLTVSTNSDAANNGDKELDKRNNIKDDNAKKENNSNNTAMSTASITNSDRGKPERGGRGGRGRGRGGGRGGRGRGRGRGGRSNYNNNNNNNMGGSSSQTTNVSSSNNANVGGDAPNQSSNAVSS